MADLKISQLTGATTPLAGTEVLPIVQSGSTKKVSVADLTAGRAVASAGGTFSDNFVQGTAAKGVNFTANTSAAGMTSQLLNWYEEGTFTPTVVGTSTAGTATYANQLGRYTRVGRLVTVEIYLNWSGGTGTGDLQFGGLPFTVGSNAYGAASVVPENITLTAGNIMVARLLSGTAYIEPLQTPTGGGGLNTVPYDGAGNIMITATYSV